MGRRSLHSEPGRVIDIACTNCGRAYPSTGLPYCCHNCGGLYDYINPLIFQPKKLDRGKPGIWRYLHTFGLPHNHETVSLGEGNTSLIWAKVSNRNIAFKCEYLNPTGSFKDRGTAVIASWIKSRNIGEVLEDSSGNAGASLAAYSARGGIKAWIYTPESASGPKRRQIESYGAGLVPTPGPREETSKAAELAAENGMTYASHAFLPFNLPGYATTSYEIFEQLGKRIPGAVILPVGQGGLLLGMSRGFSALRIAYKIPNNLPRFIGLQTRRCAPIWGRSKGIEAPPENIDQKPSIAEGVQVRHPLRKENVVQAVDMSGGSICLVEEDEILPGRDELAHLGFYVEPTSAIVWSALVKMLEQLPDPIVVILTGSGMKYEPNKLQGI